MWEGIFWNEKTVSRCRRAFPGRKNAVPYREKDAQRPKGAKNTDEEGGSDKTAEGKACN